MAAFEYVALDGRGRQKKGILEGDTARQIRQSLREQGLAPLQVDAVAEARARESRRPGWLQPSIKTADLALVTRQLATLMRAGMPIEESLKAVVEQTEKTKIKSILLGVRARVMEGHTLADGMSEFPNVFNHLYRSMVAAGEKSGHLDPVLERLADYTEKRQQTRQKIIAAIVYPVLLVLVAISVVSILLIFAVPNVVEKFQDMGHELPMSTRALIGITDFITAWGWLLAAVVILAFVGFRYALRNKEFRLRWHRRILNLPMIGKISRGVNSARFARTLSILHSSGVPLLDAMAISGDVLSNDALREAVDEARTRVREGSTLKGALQVSGYLPPMMLHMIGSGEASGELEEMLRRAAENQEWTFENMLEVGLSILGPLTILLMGGMVFFIVLAMLMPIIELNNIVS